MLSLTLDMLSHLMRMMAWHLISPRQSPPDWQFWSENAGAHRELEPVWCQVWAAGQGWPVIGPLQAILAPDWLTPGQCCLLPGLWLVDTDPVIIWSGELMASSWSYTRMGSKVFQEIEIILIRTRQKESWKFLSDDQNLFKLRGVY